MHVSRWLAPLTALGLILLILGTWHIQSRIKAETRATVGNSLNTVLRASQQSLHDWAGEHDGEAAIWAGFEELRGHTQSLLTTDHSTVGLLENPSQEALRKLLHNVLLERAYRGFFVIGTDGINLASSRDENVGVKSLLVVQHGFLERIWSGQSAMSLPQTSDVPLKGLDGMLVDGKPTMFIGAPIRDAKGRVIAALTFRIDPLQQFTGTLQRGRLGLSGETYAFDGSGRMISESRYDDQLEASGLLPHGSISLLNILIRDPRANLVAGENSDTPKDDWLPTVMARHALQRSAGNNLEGYRDYRGVPVVGAWLWDDTLNLGLATEIDVAEAYGTQKIAGRFLSIVSMFAGLFLCGLAFLFSWSLKRSAREDKRFRAVEARSQTILQAVGEGIIGVDIDGRTTFMNPAAAKMLGYDNEELIGLPAHDLVRREDNLSIPGDKCILHGVLADGNAHHGVQNMLCKLDGTFLPIESTTTPLRNDGVISGAVITFMDISERQEADRRLRESEQRFALALKGANAGVFDWNLTSDDVFFSPEYKNMLGYDETQPDDTLRIRHCIHPDDSERAYEQVNTFLAGTDESYDVEYRLRHKDGHYLNVLSKGFTFRDAAGVATRMIGVSSDGTWRKQTEEELREAKLEAEQANKAKSMFLSSMSHELRTPMNAILGFAQLLGFDKNEPLTANQTEFVHQIRSAGDHLLGLIDEVLDLSKIEAGKVALSIEDVCVEEAVADALTLIETMTAPKNITVINETRGHADAVIRADYSRCKQAMLNLLSNAVKYNRDSGTVTVSSSVTADGMLRISVSDTGEGIPEEKHDELFRPFSRLGAESTDIEGTGIGLSITKKLVELQDGRIGFHSKPGVGSTFWIDWPLRDGEPATVMTKADAAAEDELDVSGLEGASVLYIEDNPANLKLVENLLGGIPDLTLLSAHNAEFGLKLADHLKPGVILMDINLPGLNGFEALKVLRRKDRTKEIPVIALTADAMPGDTRRGVEAGFYAYLTKPLDVALTLQTIVDALHARGPVAVADHEPGPRPGPRDARSLT